MQTAYQELSLISNEKISDKNIDHDWFARWHREAKVVGKEKLQKLWGQILAKEIEKPNSFSYRTLNVIKNLSSKEARLFEKALRYQHEDSILINEEDT